MSTVFDDVILLSPKIQPILMTEVEALEQHLGVTLPSGYREFITRFGEGDYCDLLHIYPPARIRKEYVSHREFLKTWYDDIYKKALEWFLGGSEPILNGEQLQACVIVGDSFDGDYIVYHPPHPDKLFVLPRHQDQIQILKADFSDLHLWINADAEPRLKTFMPWHDQTHLRFRSEKFSLDRATCLAKFRQHWNDNLIVMYDEEDEWSWDLIFFLPSIGGRIQIQQDEGVTRNIPQENATVTYEGSGVRRLFMDIDLDKEAVEELKAFIDDLQAQGLGQFDSI